MTTIHLSAAERRNHQSPGRAGRIASEDPFTLSARKTPVGWNTEFVLGELIGWRSTLHSLYRDCAEDIVAHVVARTDLTFPAGEVPNGTAHAH